MGSVSLATALAAGFISFASPCVLPLVPAYLSFISGVSLEQIRGSSGHSGILGKVAINSVGFVLGFSLVFVSLGASATVVGRFLLSQMALFAKVAGVILVIFGLHLMGVFRIRFLSYEKRFQTRTKPTGLLGSFVVGLAFAFGWTPCIGPILAAILAYAGTQKTVGQGVLLLAVYSIGLGVPFLLAGLGINTFLSIFARAKRYLRAVEVGAGVLLIAIGLMIFFGSLAVLSGYFARWFPWLARLG